MGVLGLSIMHDVFNVTYVYIFILVWIMCLWDIYLDLAVKYKLNYNKLKWIWHTNANMKKIWANIAAKYK
jgi:hypothetical protein